MLKNKKFKMVVSVILMFTFMNLSIPFNSFVNIKANASEQKASSKDKTVKETGFLKKSLNSLAIEYIYVNSYVISIIDKVNSSISDVISTNEDLTKIKSSKISSLGNVIYASRSKLNTNNQDSALKNILAGSTQQTSSQDEIVEERTANAKIFKKGDKKLAQIYEKPIHYKDKDGKYKDINNNLVPSKYANYNWENKANSFKTYFAKDTSSSNLVQVGIDNNNISWQLLGVTSEIKGKTLKNTITYNGVFDDVDLRYTVGDNSLKEDFILHSKNVPNNYKFKINTGNLTYVQEKSGDITFKNPQGNKVFTINKPYMYDQKDAKSNNVNLSIEKSGNDIFITVIPDKAWIETPDRSFPIYLDPTIQPDGGDGRDTYVASNHAGTNYRYDTVNFVGRGSESNRTYIVFTNFRYEPGILGSKINSANLLVNEKTWRQAWGGFDLYEVGWNWDWNYPSLTWNNQQSLYYNTSSGGGSDIYGWWNLNITGLAQKWAFGAENNGVALINDWGPLHGLISCDYVGEMGHERHPRLDVIYTPEYYAPSGSISINWNAAYTTSQYVNLSLNAWDDSWGTDIKMRFSNDGYNYSSWEPFSYNKGWSLSGGEGNKNVYVQYLDGYGRVSTYVDYIKLDTQAPIVGSLTGPTNGLQTKNRTVTFNWSAANDPISGVKQYILVASPNVDMSNPVLSKTLGAGTLQYTHTFSADYKNLYWKVYVDDNVGHRASYNYRTLTIDSTAPPIPAFKSEPAFTPTLQNTLSWSLVIDAGVGGVTYEMQKSTTNNFSSNFDTYNNLTAASYTVTNLREGIPYYYRLRAKDSLGNTSYWSTVISSIQDNTAPVINNLATAPGIFSPGINTTRLTASINEANLSKWDIAVSRNSTVVKNASGTGNNLTWVWDGKDNNGNLVNEGNYVITVKTTDKAGNTSSKNTTVIVDRTPATINVSLPTVTNLGTYKVQGTYNDNNLPLVSIVVNGVTATFKENNVFEADISLTEGTNFITIKAQDRAGNITTVSKSVLMDATSPTISNQSPENGTYIGISKPTIKADYLDLLSGININTVRVYVDGTEVTDKANISASGFTYFPETELNKGIHNVKVELEDNAANKQSASWEFNVDLDTFVSILKPVNNSNLNKTLTEVTGFTEKGNNLELFVNDKMISTFENADNNFNFTNVLLTEGSNTLKVVATDIFNNTKDASVNVNVNTKAPAASVNASLTSFSPNGDVQQDIVTFQLSAESTSSQLKDWTLSISNATGSIVRTFTGLGAPQSLVQWDGKDDSGNIVSDGKYTYHLMVRDFAGTEISTADNDVYVDTVAPAAPVIQKPASDMYSNQATVEVGGSAEPGTTITLYNNDTIVDVTKTDETGNWSYVMPLYGGINAIKAKATDNAGNISNLSNMINVTVTAVPPIKKVEATPLVGSSGKIIAVTVTTTDITKNVQMLTPEGKVINLMPFNLTTWTGYWVVGSNVGDGIAVLNFSAEDLSGSRGRGTVAVVIDNTPPQVPVIKTPVGQIDTNKDNFTFSGEGEPNSKVSLYTSLNGNESKVGETTVAANGLWNINAVNLAEGTNEVWAISTDAVQNISGKSDKVVLRVDRTAPSLTGQINPLYIPVGHSLHFSAISAIDTTQLLVKMPDGAYGYGELDSLDWKGDITVGTSIADGTYDVVFYAFDAAGNKGIFKTKLIVDSTPPNKPVIKKPVHDEFTNNPNYQIKGTAEAGSTLTLYYWDNEGMKSKSIKVASDGTWKTTAPLLEGANTLHATATDLAGNVSVESDQIRFILDTIPPIAPYINTPPQNFLTNKPQQVISGTGEPYATITLNHNGNIVDHPVVNASGEWTSKTLTFTEGSNRLQAKATDRAQNTGSLSTEIKTTLDTIPPNPPLQSVRVDRNSPVITASGTAEANSTITVYLNDSPIGTTQVDGNGNWQFRILDTQEGKIYNIYTTATDAATNVSGRSATNKILRYRVVSGDDLQGIAGYYYGNGSRYNEIVQFNGLSSERIYHGWYLLIPNPQREGIYSSYRIEMERIIADLERKLNNLSNRNNSGKAGEPVNTSLGNFFYNNTDIRVAGGKGIPLEITRGYNSMDFYHGPFGYGWNFNYNIKLNFYQYNDKDYVEVINYDGRRDLFTKNQDGTYQSPQGIHDNLKELDDGSFVWETKDKVKYQFNYAGRLMQFTDKNGNTNKMEYNDQGLLTAVTDTVNRKLNFTYDNNRRIISIKDPTQREFKYGYDDNNNLTSITYPDGGMVKYAYDDNHQMTSFTDPNGNYVVRNTYDLEGRVNKQLDAKGNLTTFTYDTENRKTTIIDGRGNKLIDEYDDFNRLVVRTDQYGNTEKYTYDARGNRNSITDKNGHTTYMEYDQRGNRTLLRNTLGQVVKFTYDEKDNPTGTTDQLGHSIKITYDNNGNPLTMTDARGNTTHFEYNEQGQITAFIDAKSQKTIFEYDSSGNVTGIKDAKNQSTTFQYNQLGWKTAVTTPKEETTKFEYDPKGNNTAVINPLGQSVSYSYDQNGNIISIKDARGNTTKYFYDANGKMVKIVDANGVQTYFDYDANGNQTGITNSMGNKYSYQFDGLNRLTNSIDPLGNQTIYGYDPNGNLTTVKDPRNNVTSFVYDALNRPIQITNALNNTVKFTYDEVGNLAAYTDQAGNTTRYTYNPNNQLEKITDVQDHSTQIFYDVLGNQEKIIDAKGNSYNYSYDATGKLTKITDPLNHDTTIDYDADGNKIGFTDANGNTTKFDYDALSRITSITDALNNSTKFTYDANNNRTAVADANGNQTQYAYDALNRLTKVINAVGTETDYTYDALGNLIQVKDGNNNITKYEFDANNRVTAAIDPLGNITKVNYDPAGNIANRTDGNGAVTNYTYNSLNQLTKVLYPDNNSVKYSYNELGSRTQMIDRNGTTGYKYDSLGRLLEVADANGKNVDYTYDELGNRTSIHYPDSKVVKYIYDELNRLQKVTDWDGKTTSYEYDATGRRTKTMLPNGANTSYQYDAANRLTDITNLTKSGTISYKYNYDKVGNRTSVTEADGSTTQYQYDPLYQLTKVIQKAGKTTDYTYDKVGNRLTMSEIEGNSTATTKYEYNGASELLKKIDSSGQITNYQYDKNGNRIAKIGNNYTNTYGYDYENRLTNIDEHNGKTIEYAYNGDGVRLSKTVNNPNNTKEVSKYVNDVVNPLEQVLAIYDGNDNLESSYVYGLERISDYDMDTSTGKEKDPLYYLYDGLGSAVSILDSTGKVADQYRYDEYGNQQPGGKQSPNAQNVLHNYFGFTGEQWDAEAGLQYLRARYYDPEIGRFINRDSVLGDMQNPLSQNRYAYAWNNPVNMTDPSGHKPAGMSYEEYIAYLQNQIRIEEQKSYNPSTTSCNNGGGSSSGGSDGGAYDDRTSDGYSGGGRSTNGAQQSWINKADAELKRIAYGLKAELDVLAGDYISAVISFFGIGQNSLLSKVLNTVGDTAFSVTDALKAMKAAEKEVGFFGKIAFKAVGSVFSILMGAMDFAMGLGKMVEAANTADDYLRTIRYFSGSAKIISGLSGIVAGVAALMQAWPVAAVAAGVCGFFAIADIGLEKLEDDYYESTYAY